METIKVNFEGNGAETVTGSDTFNLTNATGSDTAETVDASVRVRTLIDTDTDNVNTGDNETDTETATAAVIEKVQNNTSIDTYIAIFKAGDIMQKRGMAVKMVVLALIERGELYKAKGYTSTIELAEREFNLSAQTTRSYLQAAEKFYNVAKYAKTTAIEDLVDNEGNFKQIHTNSFTSIFADLEGNDFTPSALESMRSLSADTIATLLEDNVINYNMSARDIKKAIKPYRQRKNDNTGENVKSSDTETVTSSDTKIVTGSDNDNVNDEIAALKAEIARLTAENQQLQAEKETLQAENENLQTENSALKNSVNSYKGANTTYKNANATLKAENATLKAENETLKAAGSDTETVTGSDTDNENATGSDNDNTPVTISGADNDNSDNDA